MLIKIQPLTFPILGIATQINYNLHDNAQDRCDIIYQFLNSDNNVIVSDNCKIDGTDYTTWDNTNAWAENFMLTKLGCTKIS